MVCPEGCGRGSARAGSAAMGHPRLLAGGTKEEEKGEEDVAVLGLEGGKGGGDGEVVKEMAGAHCWRPVAHHRRRSPVPGPRGSGKGRVSALDPKLLRSFPDNFFGHSFSNDQRSFLHSSSYGENYSFKHLTKALTQLKLLIRL